MLPNAFILLTTPRQPHCMKNDIRRGNHEKTVFVSGMHGVLATASQALPIDWGASLCPLSRLVRRRAAKGVTLVSDVFFLCKKNAKWIQWEVVKAYVQDWWPAKALWNQHIFCLFRWWFRHTWLLAAPEWKAPKIARFQSKCPAPRTGGKKCPPSIQRASIRVGNCFIADPDMTSPDNSW